MATKAQAKNRKTAAKTHAKNSKERAANILDLKALYIKEKDNPVVLDILKKAKSFAEYHTKMAKDGVGVRKTGAKDGNGQDEMETVYYTNDKRVSEIDKAAGIEELVNYIERQYELPKSQ